jgi:hypothetical protein
MAANEPAISVDTKKKELVGDFKNAKGLPEKVRVHDLVIPEFGRAASYGFYDIANSAGWVSVGIDHDTARLRGQRHPKLVADHGRARYPTAKMLTLTADGGGSNGSRVWLWKIELQKLADELGLTTTVCHATWHQMDSSTDCFRSSLRTGAVGRL